MKPFTIGVTGGSGSGKTTFIRKIRERFGPDQVCIVSADDYYLPREQQFTDGQGEKNFDLPKSFDKKALLNDINKLIDGQTVTKEEYTFNRVGAQPKILTFRPAPVLIVEGLFVLHYKKIAPLFDLKIFVNTKETLKVIRRIHRDQVERGYPIEDVLYKYENHVLPSYERYILPYKDMADIIINNNSRAEEDHMFDTPLMVIHAFLQSVV